MTVRFTARGAVGLITLDSPPVNAISPDLIEDLEEAVELAADAAIRAVVVAGTTHFAAGADIKEFKRRLDDDGDPAELGEMLSRVLVGLESLPKPVIAAMTGFTLGGGMELALACDFRLMAADGKCGQPEVKLGIFPGAGGTQRLPRLVGLARARELIYSGRQLTADEALEIGLVDEVHQDDEVLEAALARATEYAAGPTTAIGHAKRAINQGYDMSIADGLALEAELFSEVFATEDAAAGIDAFLGRRQPDFTGR